MRNQIDMYYQFLAAVPGGLTLDDVRLTATNFMPILDALKSVFMFCLPYLLSLIALKVAMWGVPTFFGWLIKKK